MVYDISIGWQIFFVLISIGIGFVLGFGTKTIIEEERNEKKNI